jgi:hypothetical protein
MMDVSFLQEAESTTDSNSYTFASQNLGTADAARYIVVVVQSRGTTSGLAISSVTVAGSSATIAVQLTNTASAYSVCGIAIVAIAAGTSGDIVVATAANALRCAIQVYRVVGINSVTAYDTGGEAAADPTDTINVPAGGLAIGGASSAVVSGQSTAWTGITEDDDQQVGAEALWITSAHDVFEAEQTGLTILANFASSSVSDVMVVASWAPAAAAGGGRRHPLYGPFVGSLGGAL